MGFSRQKGLIFFGRFYNKMAIRVYQFIIILWVLLAKKAYYFLDDFTIKWLQWAGFTLSEQGLFNLPYAVQSCLGNFTMSRFLSLVSDG
jgi:hypothetical protein